MKIKFIIIGLLIFTLMCCEETDKKSIHQIAEIQTNKIFDSLVQIRRDLHKHPELSGYEKRTSKIIAKYLSDLGLEVKTGIAGNGIVGILNGAKSGKKIAWRADMDAIKINSEDKTHFKSQNEGIAHMCGHDVHTTIGLGIANVLANQKETIDGTVYFIFQPSEETFTGARDMIKDGLFDIIKPDEIYGLHIGPAKTGTVSTKAKELFAYQKTIQVKLKPKTNEKEAKTFLTSVLQELVRNNPNSSPWSLDYLTDSELGLENKETIYKDYFILQNTSLHKNEKFISFEANFLETNVNNIDSIPFKINERISNSKFKDGLISIEYSGGNPTVYNNVELTKITLNTIDSLYNKELTKPMYGQIPHFNEDFIYYQQKVPGVMFLLGGTNIEKGIISMPHSLDFAVDEDAMKYGVKYFSSLILERINSN